MSTSPATADILSSTPILDRQLPPPPAMKPSETQRRASTVIVLALMLLPIAWVVLMDSPEFSRRANQLAGPLARFLDNAFARNSPEMSGGAFLWLVFCPVLALLAMVAVHELGHLIAGKFTGFRALSISIGPVEISPPFHIKWRRKSRMPGAAGFTILFPVHSDRLRDRAIVMLLGGPLANLATATAVMLTSQATSVFSGWFALFSLLVGLANLIPFRKLALQSEGKLILMLLRN